MGASSRKFSELRSLKMKINILLLCTFLTLVAGSPVPENIQPGNNTKWSPVLENFQPGYEMHTEIAKRNVDANGRKKRDVDTSSDVIERVNEIYTAVVQREECMEKIACEVGALAGDVGLTRNPALKLAEGFMPSKYKTYYKQFVAGKDCHKIKCGTFA